MTSGAYIHGRLHAWARRRGLPLQGSKGHQGAPNYTLSVESNLFGGKLLPAVLESFERGAGGELRGSIPSMSALHSSAALAVNLFPYWLERERADVIATLLEVPSRKIGSARFEDCFPVCQDAAARGFRIDPHLDFGLRYADGGRVGVECKLFEPCGRLDDKLLNGAYIGLQDEWEGIPACLALGRRLNLGSDGYRRLDAGQLLKHILGLKMGTRLGKWRLIYLYLDAPGPEAGEHREEIARFRNAVAPDGIHFVALSVQEFILRAVSRYRTDHHEYVDYLAERYL